MKKHIFLTVALIITIACSAVHVPANDKNPHASVSKNQATITLPKEFQPVYKWNKSDYPIEVVEYEFLIYPQKYQAGFIIFKNERKSEKSGPIEELINDGILDIWKQDGMMSTPINNKNIKMVYSKDSSALQLIINDPNTIDLLFSEKPSKCPYSTWGFTPRPERGFFKIEYK